MSMYKVVLVVIGALAVSLQMAFAQAVKVVGELAATNVDRPYTDTVPHVFGRNAAGELIHYYWSPKPGWAVENLTARANIGTAFQFASDPVVAQRLPDELHVFGRSAAGELIHYHWSSGPGWAAENLTARANIGNAFQFARDPVVALRLPDELHVFGHNAVGELIHYYWSPEPGWSAQNLTTTAPRVGP